MTAPHAVLSAEALAAYDAGYRTGKAAGLAENDELRARLDGYRRFTWPDGITEDAAEAAQRLWVALEEVRAISAAHHGEQPMAALLHALTVDIPARVDAALFADGWCGCGHHISEHGHRPGYRDGCAAFLNGIDDSNGHCVCRAFSIAPGLAEGALRRETPDGAPNDTLDALTAHAQRTGEYGPAPLDLDAIEARAKAATPGPWAFAQTAEKGFGANVGAECFAEADERAETPLSGDLTGRDDDYYVGQPIAELWHQSARPDAEFIAHARADVPALVRRVRELEAERDRLTARVAELEAAILWADGQGDDFASRPESRGPYWWRRELMERAGLRTPEPTEGSPT